MATYFFRTIGGNTNTATNWSLSSGGPADGAVPTSTDNASFDGNSGSATVNADLSTAIIDFTGYTNIITVSSNIKASGNVILSVTMNIAGAGALIADNVTSTASRTWTANGKIWGRPITIGTINAGLTLVIADAWEGTTISTPSSNPYTVNGPGIITVTGATIGIAAELVGTGTFLVNNTCAISTSQSLGINLTINSSGTITFSSTFIFGSTSNPTLTYTTASVFTPPTLLSLSNGGIINTSAVTWNSAAVVGNGITFTLTSDLNVSNFDVSSSGFANTINGSNVNVSGNLTNTFGAGLGTNGTTTIKMGGTGTWSGSGPLRINLVFNTSGTITISGTVAFGGSKTLTYTAGTMVVTSSTLSIVSSATLATSGMSWNNFKVINSITITLSSDLNIAGNFVRSGNGTTCTINSNNINISGGITAVNLATDDCNLTGTSTINLIGTGNWDGHQSANTYRTIGNPLIINSSSGTYTITGGVSVTGNFTYLLGTVITTDSDLLLAGTLTCSLNGIIWNKVSITDNITITLSSDIHCDTFKRSGGGGTCTLNGNFIYMSSLTVIDVATTWSILAGTTTLVFNGTGTWTGHTAGGMGVGNNVVIDTLGVITLTAFIVYLTGTLSYVRGTVITTSVTLNLTGSCTLSNLHKLAFGNGVVFTSGITVTMNKFFEGLGNLPCRVRPSTSGNMTVVLTSQSESHFTSIQNVLMSASSPYRIMMTTINSDKGGNAGVIFMSQQLPQGFVDQDWIDRNWEPNGYYKQWGETPIGFVRNE